MQTTWRHGVLIAGCLIIGAAGAVILARQPNAPSPDIHMATVSDDFFAEPEPEPVVNVPPIPVVAPPEPVSGTIVVSGKKNAGDDQNDGQSVELPAGTYRITYDNGCYRPAARGKWTSADLRVSYPNRDRLGTPVGIAWPNRGEFHTEKACVAGYAESERTIHHGGGLVSFWVADTNAKDNVGTITLQYEQIDDPQDIVASLTCNATTTERGRVIIVRGTAGPDLAETPIAVALPTGRSPVRFLINTDRNGTFTVGIPLASHPTDTLAIEALWPVPDTSITTPSALCSIPITGAAAGFRMSSGFAYSRIGTPDRPLFSPEDPYASSRVRINFSKIPPMRMEIGRLEYDTNPTGVATPKRALRFYRIVTDADLAFVRNGVVRFTLLKPEVTKLNAPAANVVIAKFDTTRRQWKVLPTTTIANRGGMTVVETTVAATDLRDSTFALMTKR